ncbi:MAG: helix-turn-helix domain-containing protein [Oscillospiraceae bacterium]|nr:helix-turn-helix domain-containing protein [Oscillospiraceae bacterium]
MNIREMRKSLGDTQSEFAARYNIPFRTVQNWETGVRQPPEYILDLLESRIREDLINHRTAVLPKYDPHKSDLPNRREYVGALSWLKSVSDSLDGNVVFALDEALMCEGRFGGRSDEYIVWAYGDNRLSEYNGIVLLGNHISPYCVREENGLRFTGFNRTLSDAFANESLLDMQGITEALSRYYYSNGESFNGITVDPKYQNRFERLANEAIDYYSN